MRRALRLTLSVLLLASAARAARAADDDPRRVQAEPHLREGRRLFDQARYEEALAKLKVTYEIYPSPNVLTMIASVEQKLGRSLDAIGHFREALQNPVLHPENAEIASKGIAELERHLARVDIRGPRGLVVTIGKDAHSLPLREPLDLAPGRIVGEGKLGDTTYRGSVAAPEGSVAVLEMKPERLGPSAVEPPSTAPASAGWSTGQYVGLALAGVGVAGLAAGGGFAVARANADDTVTELERSTGPGDERCRANAPPAACNDVSAARDDRSAYGALSTGFLLGGGVALVGGAITFLVWPRPQKRSPPSSGVRVTPLIDARSVGVELRY